MSVSTEHSRPSVKVLHNSQALEVMVINHKKNASNNIAIRYCYVDTIVLGYIFYDVW